MCALRTRLFPPSKWTGLFPFAAYRRSAFPQLALGRLKGKQVGILRCGLGGFAAQKNRLDFFFCGWCCPYTKNVAWDASPRLGYFCNTKGQCGFKSTLAFGASRRACCPTAVFPIQLTVSQTRLASREACRRAAVSPQPSRRSSSAPARPRRAVRKGSSPRAMRPVAEWRSFLFN